MTKVRELIAKWREHARILQGAHPAYHRNEISRLLVCARELEAALSLPDREMGEQMLERLDEQWKARCRMLMCDIDKLKAQLAAKSVQPLPASAGDSVRDLTDELVRMVIAGFENQQQGKIPANGHIHGCKSCYEQALALRSASPVAPPTDKELLDMPGLWRHLANHANEAGKKAAYRACADRLEGWLVAGASPVAPPNPHPAAGDGDTCPYCGDQMILGSRSWLHQSTGKARCEKGASPVAEDKP